MPLLASLALLAASGVKGDLWHPEWGPAPPVAPFGMAALPSERVVVPMIHPLIGDFRYRHDFGQVRSGFRHTGEDIIAPKMTPIVAPFGGILGFKRNSFWIWGNDGWAILGTHLNDDDLGTNNNRGTRDVMFAPDLLPGQRVEAGRLIGYVGDSGWATGPHLHFELYAPGSGRTMGRIRDPLPSLKAATRLSRPRAALEAPDDRPPRGEVRLQGCLRRVQPGFDGGLGSVTLLLTAKQNPDGKVLPMTRVRYIKLRVSESAAHEVGGWEALSEAPGHVPIAAYLEASARPDGAVVSRLSSAPYTLRGGER